MFRHILNNTMNLLLSTFNDWAYFFIFIGSETKIYASLYGYSQCSRRKSQGCC